MADPKEVDTPVEEDYDEEADSDFEAGNATEGIISSSCEEEQDSVSSVRRDRPRLQLQAKKRTKKKGKPEAEPLELDSGDEATIQERKRAKRKAKQKGEDDEDANSDIEEHGWRARTRAMREKGEVEKKGSKLASVKGSTVDVDQMWDIMNKPGGLDDLLNPPTALNREDHNDASEEQKENLEPANAWRADLGKGNSGESQESLVGLNDMIMIDEIYEFAGEVHTRKKTVPRSSAEAKVWLSQTSHQNSDPRFAGHEPVQRPLRKISRFDPNLNNLDQFKKNWERQLADGKVSRVQKLNTVEKSKMDWALHVDQEGLQDELSEHAKAKGGYLGRMDFLGQVEQRREEEARKIRIRG